MTSKILFRTDFGSLGRERPRKIFRPISILLVKPLKILPSCTISDVRLGIVIEDMGNLSARGDAAFFVLKFEL